MKNLSKIILVLSISFSSLFFTANASGKLTLDQQKKLIFEMVPLIGYKSPGKTYPDISKMYHSDMYEAIMAQEVDMLVEGQIQKVKVVIDNKDIEYLMETFPEVANRLFRLVLGLEFYRIFGFFNIKTCCSYINALIKTGVYREDLGVFEGVDEKNLGRGLDFVRTHFEGLGKDDGLGEVQKFLTSRFLSFDRDGYLREHRRFPILFVDFYIRGAVGAKRFDDIEAFFRGNDTWLGNIRRYDRYDVFQLYDIYIDILFDIGQEVRAANFFLDILSEDFVSLFEECEGFHDFSNCGRGVVSLATYFLIRDAVFSGFDKKSFRIDISAEKDSSGNIVAKKAIKLVIELIKRLTKNGVLVSLSEFDNGGETTLSLILTVFRDNSSNINFKEVLCIEDLKKLNRLAIFSDIEESYQSGGGDSLDDNISLNRTAGSEFLNYPSSITNNIPKWRKGDFPDK